MVIHSVLLVSLVNMRFWECPLGKPEYEANV